MSNGFMKETINKIVILIHDGITVNNIKYTIQFNAIV